MAQATACVSAAEQIQRSTALAPPGAGQLFIPVCAGAAKAPAAHSIQRLLRLSATGARDRTSGALIVVGENGNYWSSSTYASGNLNVGGLHLRVGNVNPVNNHNRANGLSVRCVQHLRSRFLSF